MVRMTLAAVLVAATTGAASADVIPVFDDPAIPAVYTPGSPFTFGVRIPALPGFRGYEINLLFETDVIDPDLVVTAAADPGRYPLLTTPTFADGFLLTPGGNQVLLQLADSGPTATPGGDLLALVTVTPGAGLTGRIAISVDGTPSVLDDRESRDDVVPAAVTVRQGEPATTPVPGPAGILSLGLGGLLLAVRNRRRGG